MGIFSSTAAYINQLFGPTEARVVVIGLDAAGKTTIMYKFRLGEVVTTIPTIGFNVETVEYKNLKFTMWDIGGQDRLRPLWRRYYDNTDAVIFVVDSADQGRMGKARDELHKMLSEGTLDKAAVLVFANKQDMPGALPPSQVMEKLQLGQSRRTGDWHVQGCSAVSGAGLYEGLDWLATAVKRIK